MSLNIETESAEPDSEPSSGGAAHVTFCSFRTPLSVTLVFAVMKRFDAAMT